MFAAVVPPPHYAQRVISDDPDEVTSWSAQRNGYHSRVVHDKGPFGFEATVLMGQRVSVAWARTELRQTLRASIHRPMVHIPIDRPQRYSFGRLCTDVGPGAMAFLPQGAETSRHSVPASLLAMELDGTALAAELQWRHPGVAFPLPRFPLACEISVPLQRAMNGALADLVLALDPRTDSTQRMNCESRMIAALVDVLIFPLLESRIGRLGMQRVADLEGWIDAHLGEVITLGQLCEVAQISQRSLQQAFQERRGMSPMRFVCERRLAAANFRLANADVADSVTGIATSLGFTHLGRFAKTYREAFGESPSRTFLRGRGPLVTSLRPGPV